LPLAMGALGWAYSFTDSGAIFEARSVHVGAGLLFALGWVALGFFLLLTGGVHSDRATPARALNLSEFELLRISSSTSLGG
jgi:hypothetical protein